AAVQRTELGVLLEGRDGGLDPAARVRERLARLLLVEVRELLRGGPDGLGGAAHSRAALGGGRARPLGSGSSSGQNGLGTALRRRNGHAAHEVAGARVMD